MSSHTVMHVEPPDIYHRLGLSGMELARSAMEIRAALEREGRYAELSRYEREYVSAIQEGIDQVDALRRQVLAQAAHVVDTAPSRAAVVDDEGVGELELGGTTGDGDAARRAALDANLRAEGTPGAVGATDLSGLLVRQRTSGDGGAGPYLRRARERLDALVPVTQGDRDRVAETRRAVDELAASTLDADGVRAIMEGRLVALERDLSEGGQDRAGELATYLALCNVMGERPDPVSYARMLEEIERLTRALVERKEREVVARKVSAALERAGLRDRGVVVLGGSRRRLLVDDRERECALALSEDGAGSFMLSTVASSDPGTAGKERRARMEASARRLCSTKQRRLLEELEAEGLVASVREDTEVDLGDIVFCREFAELAGERREARPEATRRAGGMLAEEG